MTESVKAKIDGLQAAFAKIRYVNIEIPSSQGLESVGARINDLLVTLTKIKYSTVEVFTVPQEFDTGGFSVSTDSIPRSAQISLPAKLTELDEDAIRRLNLNFKEIEYHLSVLQAHMLSHGYGSLQEVTGKADTVVIVGPDADKPQGIVARNGIWFYWATDTRKLYALLQKSIPPSPVISTALTDLAVDYVQVYYVDHIFSENVSAGITEISIILSPV